MSAFNRPGFTRTPPRRPAQTDQAGNVVRNLIRPNWGQKSAYSQQGQWQNTDPIHQSMDWGVREQARSPMPNLRAVNNVRQTQATVGRATPKQMQSGGGTPYRPGDPRTGDPSLPPPTTGGDAPNVGPGYPTPPGGDYPYLPPPTTGGDYPSYPPPTTGGDYPPGDPRTGDPSLPPPTTGGDYPTSYGGSPSIDENGNLVFGLNPDGTPNYVNREFQFPMTGGPYPSY